MCNSGVGVEPQPPYQQCKCRMQEKEIRARNTTCSQLLLLLTTRTTSIMTSTVSFICSHNYRVQYTKQN
jgi:hypothetical protein